LLGVEPLSGPTSSQLPPELVELVTVKLKTVPSVLVRATFRTALPPDPAVTSNTSAPGLTTSSAVELTTSVTPIVRGLLPAPSAVRVIDPVYVPALRPAGATKTVKAAGVAAVATLVLSQLPPLAVPAAIAMLTGAPVLVTVIDWLAGPACPVWNANASAAGFASSSGLKLTTSRTGTTTGEFPAPAAVIVMAPV